MFTVNMYCSRMNARGIRIGLVVDCTALDLEEFDPLPDTTTSSSTNGGVTPKNKKKQASKKKNALDRRVRYYHNPSEWDDFDVEYVRLVPPKKEDNDNGINDNNNSSEQSNKTTTTSVASEILPQFIQIITKYIQKSRSAADNSTTSTVHIALFDSRGGLGVASYFAAAYMCHSMKAPVHAALDAVREGSPPQPCDDNDGGTTKKWGLCDVLLVKDLQSRYRGNREIVMEGAPRWWYALEDDEDEEEEEEDHDDDVKPSADANSNGVEDESSNKRRRKEERIVIPPSEDAAEESNVSKRPRTSNDNMPPSNKSGIFPNLPREALETVSLDSQKATRAMTVLAQLTQRSLPLTSLPVKPEIDISNSTSDSNGILQSIKSNPDGYKLTWLSTKGRRGLLLILSEAVYFMEQPTTPDTNDNNNPSHISVSIVSNIRFPSSKDGQKQQHRTLLDVVLVHDVEKNNKQCFRFYALDILCIEGGMVWHKPWKERSRFLNDGVLIPRKKEETRQQQQHPSNGGHVYAKELIRIRAKEYFPMQKLEFVSNDVCAGVGHEAKGIRIIPLGSYGIGKDDTTNGTAAVVWRKGGDVDEERLHSLFK